MLQAGQDREKLLEMMITNMLKLYTAMSWRQALRISRYSASYYDVHLLYAVHVYLTPLKTAY